MKNILMVCSVLFLLTGCCAAKKDENVINQKVDAKTNKEIVLVKVVNDSRCPEGTQCIWAGEVTIEVAAYENKELVEQVTFTLNKDTKEEVRNWFMKHLPNRKENLKEIQVLPYPKDGTQIQPEDYRITLNY